MSDRAASRTERLTVGVGAGAAGFGGHERGGSGAPGALATQDMVLNIGRLRSGQVDAVREDIAAVVEAGHAHDVPVKVIFETALLDDAQKEAACRASAEAGADFVKTSTGFAGGGATLPDVRLMRANSPETVQVKASGGVRDVDTLLAMLAEGVTRIGTSSTSALLAEARERLAAGTLVVPEPANTMDTPERDSLY